MGLFRSLTGTVEIRLVSGDVSSFLTMAAGKGIRLMNVRNLSQISVTATIYRRDFPLLERAAKRRGDSLEITGRGGIYWRMRTLLRRPVFLAGILLLLCLVTYLPSRIFFVQVEGNVTVETQRILECAVDCGIRFGATRKNVRSEKVKNSLLAMLPQLQWAGVNTSGCIATISVREKSTTDVTEDDRRVSSVIAARDCVIESITVTSGDPVCSVGQAVLAGQTLVSGYTDCGLTIRATRSEAEIYGITNRDVTVIAMPGTPKTDETGKSESDYSLLIGKKVINFLKDSGISHTGCVKMYSRKYVTLPGGFSLPVAIVKVQTYDYGTTAETLTDEDWLEDYVRDYVIQHMVAGEILSETCSLECQEGVIQLQAHYNCRELVGIERNEEIIK